jgi:hypothetical protein
MRHEAGLANLDQKLTLQDIQPDNIKVKRNFYSYFPELIKFITLIETDTCPKGQTNLWE